MEETANPTFFTFDSPKGQSSYIKVIGVGGGGGNAVNHMYDRGIQGVDFIVCNTDMKALNSSPVPNKIPLGSLGLGAGNKPERARQAALAKADDIREALSHNTQMLFITAGMGGGTGTGAAPVIAEIAKSIDLETEENKKILVVAIVTRPFSFEGANRRAQAEAGIAELRKHVDSIIVVNNDKLRSFGNLTISNAFGMADDVLLTAVKGIAEIITVTAYINRDFQDINTVMENSGTALMGTGTGRGETRAHDAIEAAATSVLLDDSDIRGAKNVLLFFSYSSEHEMTIDEQTEVADYVLDKTGGSAEILWGAGPDDSLGDEFKVILIATGFEKPQDAEEGIIITLGEEPARMQPAVIEQAPASPEAQSADEPFIITSPVEVEAQPVAVSPVAEPVVAPEVEPVQAAQPEAVWQPVVPESLVRQHAAEQALAAARPHVAAPVEEAAPDQGHVYVLDDEDDEPMAEAAPVPVVAPTFEPDEQGIEIIHSAAAPAAHIVAPAPQPVATAVSPFDLRSEDRSAQGRINRIAYIHEMLRNNPNGAEVVQGIKAVDLAVEDLHDGEPSSVREATRSMLRSDGSVTANPFLFGSQVD